MCRKQNVAGLALAGLLGLSLACCASPPRAAPPAQAAPGTFSRVELVEDLDHAAEILLTRNPLEFADRAELAAFIGLQKEKLRDGMSELDFYRVLTPIVVKARCGHSGIFLTHGTEARLEAEPRYLPVLVRVVDGRLYVLSALRAAGPAAASEITAINGHPAAAMISALMDDITADGVNLTRKLYVASRVFNDLYALFIDSGPAFHVEYRDGADGSAGAVDLDGVSKAELERQASAAGFPYGLPEGG
ncbi:MAG TPA: hypothetical protein VMQ10_16855, partial [Spirochaetia bacterium]|nr:hypothetical protein [Spirochaetia bacterium]